MSATAGILYRGLLINKYIWIKSNTQTLEDNVKFAKQKKSIGLYSRHATTRYIVLVEADGNLAIVP